MQLRTGRWVTRLLRSATTLALVGTVWGCVTDPGYEPPMDCGSDLTQCHRSCVDLGSDSAHCGACGVACGAAAVCVSGACVCGGGLVNCETGCVDVSTDPANCGACGTECESEEVCSGGHCVPSCQTDETDCSRSCIELNSNPAHCGSCDDSCGTGRTCTGGQCACASGTQNCAGGCVNISNDEANCGACGQTCGESEVCSGGRCRCPGGTAACDGSCAELLSDPSNCGACGNACAANEVCSTGSCEANCGALLSQCDHSCVDLKTSEQHCGKCDDVCDDTQLCVDGICQCPPGRKWCTDSCVDLQSDRLNCGICGFFCAADQNCNAGQCQCPDGGLLCGNTCVNPKADPRHCGGCNSQCGEGEVCSEGKCVTNCSSSENLCGSSCVNLQTSNNHCGDCGHACAPNRTCGEGDCRCPVGTTSCDNVCVDTSTSAGHCGECGLACASNEICTGGRCEAARIECNDDCPHPSGINWGCQRRFLYGVNYAWETFSGDFGGIANWGQPGVLGNADAVEARMADMAAQGVDVVRWWVWPDFRGNGVNFDEAGSPIGLGSTTLADLEKALELANAYHLHLMLTLFSFDNFRPSRMDGDDEVHGLNPIATNAARRLALVNQIIRPLARAAEQSPYRDHLVAWDIINEPEWAMTGPSKYCGDEDLPKQDGLEHLTHDEMEVFVSDVIAGLRAESRALITVGGAATLWACAWKYVDIDFYQFHIYDWIDEWRPYDSSPASFGLVDKPAIMGEFPIDGLSRATYAELVKYWYENGWAGALGWAVTDRAFDWTGAKAAVSSFSNAHSCETHY